MAAEITSLLSGEAYRMSALIADLKGPYAGFAANREPQLSVIAMHLNEAERVYSEAIQTNVRDRDLHISSRLIWHEALELGKKYGVRNSQVSVLAPTGTIAFMMDCDTTGIEPDIALVKYKKLVGGGALKLVNSQVAPALRRLGYDEDQVQDVTSYLLEHDTIEGAPHLKEEHLNVFDCSFKAAKGNRSIHYMGHLRMMSAAQPFISGAISKTINLPAEATVQDVKDAFVQGWKLGLKAVAIYRDGSKGMQPLNTTKDAEKKIVSERGAGVVVEKMNGYTRVKLPDERPALTHKFSVGSHEGYLTVGLYPDTLKPGETFLVAAKEGSTVSGLLDTIATLISMCLQSGIPLKILVKKFKDMSFSPAGFTNNPDIPMAKSITDYVFRYMGMRFLNPQEREEIFGPPRVSETVQDGNKAIQTQTDKILANLTAVPEVGPSAVAVQTNVSGEASAPVCQCGTLMLRTGSCYTCPNCFATTGVCN